MLRRFLATCRFSTRKDLELKFELKKDPYNALHYTLSEPIDSKQFESYMTSILSQNKNGATSSIWVHLNTKNLHHVSSLVNVSGFKIHRGKDNEVSLYRWMRENKKDLVPAYSMFVISCGGIIIHNNRILLVCEKSGQLKGRYGLPGGRADLGECIRTCSEREVWQEVGLKVKFNKVLWFRQLSSYVYGSFDTYFACIMDIEENEVANLKLCQDQVALVEWIHLSQLGSFMANRSTGTQLKLANYIQKLYNQGYDFKSPSNYRWEHYVSNIDNKQRFFGEHMLGD